MAPASLSLHVKWTTEDRQLLYYTDGSVSYQTLAGIELWKDNWNKNWEQMLPVVMRGEIYLFSYRGGLWGVQGFFGFLR